MVWATPWWQTGQAYSAEALTHIEQRTWPQGMSAVSRGRSLHMGQASFLGESGEEAGAGSGEPCFF